MNDPRRYLDLCKEFEIPEPPAKWDYQRFYAYSKGRCVEKGFVSERKAINRVLEQSCVIEYEALEDEYREAKFQHKVKTEEVLDSIYKALCSKQYLGIEQSEGTSVLFDLAARQAEAIPPQGLQDKDALKQLGKRFEESCTMLRDQLQAASGCYEDHNLFRVSTEFEYKEAFVYQMDQFLELRLGLCLADQKTIAQRFADTAKQNDVEPHKDIQRLLK